MTDPSGAQVRLEYNEDSLVIARHYASNPEAPETEWHTEHTFYDKVGRVIAQGAARFQYDACGRLTGLQDPIHGTRHFHYDSAGQLTAVANGVGGVTRYEYDLAGNLVKTIDPLGNVSSREYDDAGRLVAEIDPLGRKTTAGYDAAGRLVWQRTGGQQELRWTYDRAGQLKTVGTPTRVLAEYARDAARRCVTITDHTKNAGTPVEHVLRFDGVGNLLSHTRDGQGPSWTYDNEGRVVSVTDPTGVSVSVGHDLVGRVTLVEHPVFGQIVYTYDHEGQLVATTAKPKDDSAPSVSQAWEYAYGALSRHEVAEDGHESVVTEIARDDLGRIASVKSSDGTNAQYAFDGAHQLVGVYTVADGESSLGEDHTVTDSAFNAPATELSSEWVYDTAGRLIRETNGRTSTEYTYDAASQLLSRTVTNADGSVETVTYAYDGAGRRISERSDSTERVFEWSETGRLTSITTTAVDPWTGAPVGEPVVQELWVDALGDLAQIDGMDLWWDTTSSTPQLLSVGGVSVTHAPAGNTIVDGQVSVAGWRSSHPSHPAAPWSQDIVPGQAPVAGDGMGAAGAAFTGVPGLPEHVQLTGNGQLNVQGLDWLGARLYDPSTRGFLSTDPLEPSTGAGWASNPYSYAGNDPVHQIDPLGLSPVSAEELKAYSEARQGQSLWSKVKSGAASVGHAISDSFIGDAWRGAGNWIKKHPYITGGLMVATGALLMMTGVGGPAGVVLIGAASGALTSGGASLIAQQATTGEIDGRKVWTDIGIGAAGGAIAGGLAGGLVKGARASVSAVGNGSTKLMDKVGQKMLSSGTSRSALSAGGGGATSNVLSTAADREHHSFMDYVASASLGFGFGAGGSVGIGKLSSTIGTAVTRRINSLKPAVRVNTHRADQLLPSVRMPSGRIKTHLTEQALPAVRSNTHRADQLLPPVRNHSHRADELGFRWGGFAAEQLVDRTLSAGASVLNTKSTGDDTPQGAWGSAIQGFANGSAGAVIGRH